MIKLSSAIKYIKDSDYRFRVNVAHGMYRKMDDRKYIKKMFHAKMGYDLDLDNPQTFNEKLQWLKLNDRKPAYTKMVDKYAVKEYVASIIGEKYVIPTIGVWEDVEDIDFNALPEQFVLKCTHDSHGVVICHDKERLDIDETKKTLKKALNRNYYYRLREWPYKDVKPRIIAEPYLEDKTTGGLWDYKVFCFNGVPKCYKVDYDRFTVHKANYYTITGELIKIGEEVCPPDFDRMIPVPSQLNIMIKLAEKLSKGHSFLRTDFYIVDGNLLFGELTFYPASGYGHFVFEGNDELLGSWLELPSLKADTDK